LLEVCSLVKYVILQKFKRGKQTAERRKLRQTRGAREMKKKENKPFTVSGGAPEPSTTAVPRLICINKDI